MNDLMCERLRATNLSTTNEAADLIEQLQRERDELAATVDRLKLYAIALCDLTEEGEFYERGEAANDLMEVVEATPQDNLNAIKQEVALQVAKKAVSSCVIDKWMKPHLENELVDYINKQYPRTEGE